MKNILFFLIAGLLLLAESMSAQTDYSPLLKDGKVWNMSNHIWDLIPGTSEWQELEVVEYVKGDTIVDGEKYFKVYTNMTNTYTGEMRIGTSPRLLQEADRKVWELSKNREGEWVKRVLFDFGQEVGETFKCILNDVTLTLVGIDSISVGGTVRRRYTHEYTCPPRDDVYRQYWVEGIGSQCGPLTSSRAYNNMRLKSCYEDGVCIFTGDDFNLPPLTADIKQAVPTSREQPTPLYDLQGRRLKAKPAHGIYIKDKKKVLR